MKFFKQSEPDFTLLVAILQAEAKEHAIITNRQKQISAYAKKASKIINTYISNLSPFLRKHGLNIPHHIVIEMNKDGYIPIYYDHITADLNDYHYQELLNIYQTIFVAASKINASGALSMSDDLEGSLSQCEEVGNLSIVKKHIRNLSL